MLSVNTSTLTKNATKPDPAEVWKSNSLR